MKKYLIDFKIDDNIQLSSNYSLIKLSPCSGLLPEVEGGQFAQIEIPNSKETFLRRPISICFFDKKNNQLWLLVRKAGKGTESLINSISNTIVNMMLPLGNGFSYPTKPNAKVLLIGGGVGVAPLLYWGALLKAHGYDPLFLLAAKSENDLLLKDYFEEIGNVYVSTDDGSAGEKGLVIYNTILKDKTFDKYYCCGPMPMMKGIAKIAHTNSIDCEVSLENVMACGVGACLCCVEDTVDDGNVCVCKEGPVFNINRLKW
ncbi:MAG: dihydroorotate dehydrogenase electron transfer subunit [Muribaculaceae bacterium]|nr:dihydroorotate dehydrogenase electron transfer subunit [Muribaculaceae bacterium]